jgi:hypothetical protein
MSGPGAGFEYPPYEVTWLKRDVLLFANSIGCTADELHFLFVNLPFKHPILQLKQSRNSTQILQCSLHIQPSYVSPQPHPTYPEKPTNPPPSIQKVLPRSNRLLRSPSLQPDPRCSEIRLPPRRRRPTPAHIPKTASPNLCRQDVRDPQQGHWRLRQRQSRQRRRDATGSG